MPEEIEVEFPKHRKDIRGTVWVSKDEMDYSVNKLVKENKYLWIMIGANSFLWASLTYKNFEDIFRAIF